MALVLNATAGDPDANSYATAAEGDTYHEGHLYASTWTGATTATKEAALVMATRILEERYTWYGSPTESTQALGFPRSGLLDIHQWDALDEDTIPDRLKWATAELARQLMDGDRTTDSQIETQGVTSMSAGPVSFSFKNEVKAKVVPDAVRNMIPTWWGRLKGAGLTRPGVR